MIQVRKNLLTNLLSMVVNIIVGILYTPFLVRNLGVAAYGVIPLSLLLNQYINILANSLTRAVTRFYTVECKKGNYEEASSYFSSSIVLTCILAFVFVPLCCIPIHYLEHLLDIPQELLSSAKVLFFFSIISFFLSVSCNCINTTIFSENRLDLINYIKIIRHLSKLIFNIVFFSFFDIDLIWVGVSYFLSEVAAVLFSIYAYKITKPKEIVFSVQNTRYSVIKPVFNMIIWVALISFADTFIYKIDSILVTNYFGISQTGMLASMTEIGSYCISIASIIGSLLSPLILISYSENRHVDVRSITVDGGYVVGLIACLMCGVIMGGSYRILYLWLTPEIAENSIWMVIKMAVIPYTTVGAVYSNVFNYWNKVKVPAIISLVISAVYVLISVVLLEMGVNIIIFLLLNIIAVFAQGYVMNMYMLCKIYPEEKANTMGKVLKMTLYFGIVLCISYVYFHLFNVTNLLQLVLTLILAGLTGLVIIFMFINETELYILDMIIPVKRFVRPLIKKRND